MPLLNFRPEFAALVESGKKRQTIRARRKDGRDPKPGDTLYLYTGCRTKKARKLGEVICLDIHKVSISWSWRERGVAALCGSPFTFEETATRDGFASASEMLRWFERVHGLPFDGLLIRW